MSADLSEGPLHTDPFEWFELWFEQAMELEISDPNACAVATVSADGQPSLRVVLLKEWGRDGFVFYTNLTSRKGREALAHGKAAMTFWWRELGYQIRIEGPIAQVDDARADDYFASRARGSQIGAWASDQSAPLGSRQELLDRAEQLEREYEGRDVPRPPHWSGLIIEPLLIEFWAAGDHRLHDRFVFERAAPGEAWTIRRLNP